MTGLSFKEYISKSKQRAPCLIADLSAQILTKSFFISPDRQALNAVFIY